tara:strand:+ start:1534 stop:1698 length:165 start_codon:yes stop_codon:yes gene_type:complete
MIEFIGWVAIVVMVASIIVAVTPTPKDNELVGKAYKCLEVLALNIWKAKDNEKK